MSESFELFSNVDNEDNDEEEEDYHYERMTSSEVFKKLEEVSGELNRFYR